MPKVATQRRPTERANCELEGRGGGYRILHCRKLVQQQQLVRGLPGWRVGWLAHHGCMREKTTRVECQERPAHCLVAHILYSCPAGGVCAAAAGKLEKQADLMT